MCGEWYTLGAARAVDAPDSPRRVSTGGDGNDDRARGMLREFVSPLILRPARANSPPVSYTDTSAS